MADEKSWGERYAEAKELEKRKAGSVHPNLLEHFRKQSIAEADGAKAAATRPTGPRGTPGASQRPPSTAAEGGGSVDDKGNVTPTKG